MFLKYIDFIFQPFRAIYNKWLSAKNIKGNFQVDVNRAKAMGKRGQAFVGDANAKVGQYAGGQPQAAGANGQPAPQQGPQPQMGYQQQQAGPQNYGHHQGAQNMQPGMPGMPPMGAPPGMPGMPMGAPQMPGGAPNPNPPVRTSGFWIFKKKFCSQCEQRLDKTWDSCPYCAQIAQQAAMAPAKLQKLKTQAFVLDSSGGPGSVQLLGWLVPLQGAHRGELFTLQPKTVIGNGSDATVTLVLNDKFMSSKHAEIVAENGLWILRDIGSTNGTYVNNRRVDRHELVDNDFIKFGSAMLKFKSL
ncbi:MAG: FHA domain-containing protein [Kofleriaceae bacterium]